MNYVFSRFRFRRELILKLIINLLVDSLILQGLDQMLIAEIFGEWQLPFLMEAVQSSYCRGLQGPIIDSHHIYHGRAFPSIFRSTYVLLWHL